MFNRIRNFDSKYSSTFFLISLIIIISFLIYISFNNKVRERSCTYLIEKNYNEEKYVYYLNYTDFLEKKSNGSFGKLKDNYIINNVDNNLLILDYINELSLESDVTTINGRTCYVNVKNDLTLCIDLDYNEISNPEENIEE